jgi:hypothetical protein
MPNFIIKTHQKDTAYKGNQIFILNKGMNAGKPKKNPLPTALLSYVQTTRMPKRSTGLPTAYGNQTSGTNF